MRLFCDRFTLDRDRDADLMPIKLDDLNPANTFERRLLEYLARGEPLPIKVEHVGAQSSSSEFPEFKSRIDDYERRIASLENSLANALATIQKLYANMDALARASVLVEIRDAG